MDNEELLNKNKLLEEELQKIKNELIETKEHLKAHYENHKQELLEKIESNPIPIDKRKEYDKKYYLKKKENNSENNCVICMEQCINKFYICCKCGHKIHNICFVKHFKQICSICKYYIFMYKEKE